MNARFVPAHASSLSTSTAAVATAAPRAALQAAPVRHVHRERDFGIGYGNSSGYGRERHYTSNAFAPKFRCA